MIEGISVESLAILFFFVATFYSIVGFGGGSSYSALLLLFSVSYTIAPSISLICNIIVVAGGCFYFIKYGHLSWKTVLPFIIFSVPFSFLGGMVPISKFYFQLVLGVCLLIGALKMLCFTKENFSNVIEVKEPSLLSSSSVGIGLGFVSGLVGIGGGIFLAPIMYTFRWGKPKQIAATTSIFIFVNSLAGLIGQFQKGISFNLLSSFSLLFIAVLIGGQFGSLLCNLKISQRLVERLTALLILMVSSRLLINVII